MSNAKEHFHEFLENHQNKSIKKNKECDVPERRMRNNNYYYLKKNTERRWFDSNDVQNEKKK